MIAWNNVQLLVGVRLTKKNLGAENFGLKLVLFDIFSSFIAQDCSLGQYLTSNRAETFKKNVWHKLGPSRPKSVAYI